MNEKAYDSKHRALIVVDVQNDFLPGGSLAVKNGDDVIAPINRLLAERSRLFDAVVATQDWHPSSHESFAHQHIDRNPGELIELHGLTQVLWPDHCVQGSRGAEFSSELMVQKFDRIFTKGSDPRVDSYSGFFDNGRRSDTGLNFWLKEQGITKLVIAGLATDYCVKFTVIDALKLGFAVSVITDAVRGVNLTPGDSEKALAEMTMAGARLVSTKSICEMEI